MNRLRAKLMRIQADHGKVSRGYALGVFLGTTPFIGMKVFIALVLTSLFRWSRVASVVGVYHINVLTAPLFYGFSYLVGKTVTGSRVDCAWPETITVRSLYELFLGNVPVFISLLTGGLILGIPMAVGAYFLSNALVTRKPAGSVNQ
jgi:uncharacterized protein (DUF2062 family)